MNLVLAGDVARAGGLAPRSPPARCRGQAVTGREIMTVAALAAWLLTAGLGLYMFTIWLIEDDGSDGGRSYRRLRAPVVFGHAGLAVTGLGVWFIYSYVDISRLAWVAILILVLVAILGVVMFTNWIPVHRMARRPSVIPDRQESIPAGSRAGPGPARGPLEWPGQPFPGTGPLPPERNFPLPVVVLHGVFAVVTVTLVVLATLLS